MKNFVINNAAEVSTIDIFGEIGEGWLDEGVTMDSINNQLSEITSKDVTINISSLGGDVNHALAIYDLLKMNGAKVTANIIGMTASAGTIIALGADEVNMSENAMFLVHNVWTSVQGNASDMREKAEELDKFDDRLVNIYKKKTGKKKSEILSLMEDEKWINGKEAKAFGFVDNVFAPTKIAASVIKNINNSKYLPKFKSMEDKNLLQEIFDKVKNIGVKDEALVAQIGEFKAQVEAFEAEKLELNNKLEANEVEISESKAIIENHAAEVEGLKNELDALKAKTIVPKKDADSEVENITDPSAIASMDQAEKIFRDLKKDINK